MDIPGPSEEQELYEMGFAMDNNIIMRKIESIANQYSQDLEILKACRKAFDTCRKIVDEYGYIDPKIVTDIEDMVAQKYGNNKGK